MTKTTTYKCDECYKQLLYKYYKVKYTQTKTEIKYFCEDCLSDGLTDLFEEEECVINLIRKKEI